MSHRIALAGLLAFAPLLAHAGHGEEFLIVDEPGGPDTGTAYLVGDLARVAQDGGTSAGLRLAYGVSGRLAVHLGGTSTREAGNWRYDGTSAELEWSLTDPGAGGLHAGVSVGYTVVPGSADESELRLGVTGGDEDEAMWAANVFVEREDAENTVGAALGGRWALRDGVALAVEAESPLQRAEGARLLVSAHVDTSDAWALKAGLGGERGGDGTAALAQLRVYVRMGR